MFILRLDTHLKAFESDKISEKNIFIIDKCYIASIMLVERVLNTQFLLFSLPTNQPYNS